MTMATPFRPITERARLQRKPSNAYGYTLAVAAGSASLLGATSVQVLPIERIAYAAILVVAFIGTFRTLSLRGGPLIRDLSFLWLAFAVLYGILSLSQPTYTSHIASDAAIALLPLCIALGVYARPASLNSWGPHIVLIVLLIVAAAISRASATGPRHDAPSALAITATWYLALQSRGPVLRTLGILGVASLGYFSWTSGYRTHMVLWAIVPALLLGLTFDARRALRYMIACAFIAGSAVYLGFGADTIQPYIAGSRFEILFSGGEDESLQSRGNEVRDVIQTARTEWPFFQWPVGYGFGASYVPDLSYIESNVDESGRVHNIHFGPALVLFRYGLLGIAISATLVVFLIKSAKRHSRRSTAAFFSVAVLSLLLEFLTLNSSVQPAFAYSLGITVAAYASSRDSRRYQSEQDACP